MEAIHFHFQVVVALGQAFLERRQSGLLPTDCCSRALPRLARSRYTLSLSPRVIDTSAKKARNSFTRLPVVTPPSSCSRMHPITLQHQLSPAITLVSSLLLLLPKPRAASSDDDSALPQIRQIVVRRIRPRRALVIAAITALIVAFATDGGVLVAETLLRHPGASRRHHHRQNQPKESGRASHSWNWSEDSVSIAWAIYSLGNVLVWSAIGGWTIKTDHFIHGGLASVVGVAFVLESVLLGFVAKSVAIREKQLCFFGLCCVGLTIFLTSACFRIPPLRLHHPPPHGRRISCAHSPDPSLVNPVSRRRVRAGLAAERARCVARLVIIIWGGRTRSRRQRSRWSGCLWYIRRQR